MLKDFEREIYLIFQKLEQKGGLFITDFLSPQEQYHFQETSHLFKNIYTKLDGGFPLAERKRGFISDNKELLDYLDVQKYLGGAEILLDKKVSPSQFREEIFKDKIYEKKLGDIWLIEDKIQIVYAKEVEEDIENLFKNLNFKYSLMPLSSLIPPRGVKILKTTEASLRLDAIASFAFNISRSRMQELIRNGSALVNSKNITSPHYELKEGDLVTVKNLGFFKVNTLKETKKGRYYIEIERH